MADYYPLISRAIEALEEKSQEARCAVYDHARAALAKSFLKVDRPLLEADLKNERLALEEAIHQVESDAILSELRWPIPDWFERRFMFWGFVIFFAFMAVTIIALLFLIYLRK
ncbi:MAG: hypothetical protein WAK55_03150 [Xanthobacteraceae bacterium]